MQAKKEYLKLYRTQQNKINRLNEMLTQNPEKSEKYIKEIRNCELVRQNIESDISSVSNEVLREVLFLKYICGKNLLEVSFLINYSKRQTERFHKKALEEFKPLHFEILDV